MMSLDLLSFELMASALAVAVGAWVQGSVGFGSALVAAPVLALLAPQLVPGPLIFSSLGLSFAAAMREHGSIDRRGVLLSSLGRLPGVVLGGAALAWLSTETMGLVFGTVVLVGVALSVSGLRVAMTTGNLLGTGFLSGVMGTMTSIGGPPIALLYQHSDGPALRSTLNATFTLGSLMSLPALAWAGHFGQKQLVEGLVLMPAMVLGFALSGSSRSYLDQGRTRAAVLAVAALSAAAVLLKPLVGK